MLISLIVGIIMGGLTVLFALQNTAIVTVTFLTWQITAPLAILLLVCMLGGITLTLLVLLPFLIRDALAARTLRREKRALEDEFTKYRAAQTVAPTPAAKETLPA